MNAVIITGFVFGFAAIAAYLLTCFFETHGNSQEILKKVEALEKIMSEKK